MALTALQDPTSLTCLRCQLLDQPNMLCSKRKVCAKEGRYHPYGLLLLGGVALTFAGFIASIWR